jgi:ATP-dependent RNA helicase RhlE
MLRGQDMDQALVFTRTKRGADRLAKQLGQDGIRAAAIHGNRSQSQRVRALNAFKTGASQVLVATDIAARGLDIESLPHVVNFELPDVPEDYVHRIGRTGRAGQSGTAISLVAVEEQGLLQAIEKLLRRPIEREVVDGFAPDPTLRVASGPAVSAGRYREGTAKAAGPRHPGHQGGRASRSRDRGDRRRWSVGGPSRTRGPGSSRVGRADSKL